MNKKLLFLLMMYVPFLAIGQTTYTVLVNNFSFSPNTLVLNQGDIVTWQNVAGFHNANGSTGLFPSNPESFTSGAASSSAWTYSKTFIPIGTYQYICDIHPSMIGTIFVNGPLPATMRNITTSVLDSKCTISWETSFEENIKTYVIQKSKNASYFYDVASVNPNQKPSTYTYTDDMGAERNFYYRIKIIDEDNSIVFSPVRTAKNDSKVLENTLKFLPNPYTSHVHLLIDAAAEFESTIEIYDVFGRQILNENVNVLEGENYIHLDKTDKFSKGNYIVLVKNKSKNEVLSGIVTKQ